MSILKFVVNDFEYSEHQIYFYGMEERILEHRNIKKKLLET